MADTLLPLLPGTLPEGYCWPSDPQIFNRDIFAIAKAVFPSTLTAFNFGPDVPAPEDRDKPWIRTDADLNFIRIYTYGGFGAWVSPHPTPLSGDERRMYVGDENSLKTYDEGEDTPITPTTGPFWVVDHDWDARMPIGPGTLPSTLVVAVGDTGGEEKHVLTEAELPKISDQITNLVGLEAVVSSGGGTRFDPGSGTPNNRSRYDGVLNWNSDAHNTMPPYRAIFTIKRTARKYYRV